MQFFINEIIIKTSQFILNLSLKIRTSVQNDAMQF